MTYYILIVAVLILFIALYFSLRTLPLLLHRGKPFKDASVYHHFAVLIPARNEETVIGNLLESIQEQEYPKDKYDVFVLTNHCTDHTGDIAKRLHAHVIDFGNEGTSKGEILQKTFAKLKNNQNIDAYLIFDADNVLDHQFIKRMNDAFDEGARIAQGRRLGKNEHDNAITGAYEVFYNMQNYYFNEIRTMNKKGSAALNGTGCLLSKELVDKNGFDVHTMTEDLEYTAMAALAGVRIDYVHEAVTFDEYPNTPKTAVMQLNRWIFGQIQCTRIYTWKLFKEFLSKHSSACFDMFLIFFMPIVLLLGLVGFIMILFQPYALRAIEIILVILLIAYVMTIITMGIGLMKNKILIRSLRGGLWLFPLFMCLWVPIALISLFRKKVKWDPIKHDRKVRIEDIEE